MNKQQASFQAIRQLMEADLRAVDTLILEQLESKVSFIREVAEHLLQSGGKRLRPLLLLLSAKMCGYSGFEHQELAAVIEFIHTATLLHDDVVDHSTLRRGKETANRIWGGNTSVLVGDFLYSRAFQLMARRDNVPVMKIFANTTNTIAEGEVLQLVKKGNLHLSTDDYFEIISGKTAKLYETAAEVGALLAGAPPSWQTCLRHYGWHFGMMFQIMDDILDYTAEEGTHGKNRGDDLAEGKMTLPLLLAYQNTDSQQQQKIAALLMSAQKKQGEVLPLCQDDLASVLHIIQETKACSQALDIAKEHLKKALLCLEKITLDNPYKEALYELPTLILK